jgi:hypothetical protein
MAPATATLTPSPAVVPTASPTAALTLANVLYEKKGAIAYVTVNRPKVDLRTAFEDVSVASYGRSSATGAQFEISMDGVPRTYRDRKDHALGFIGPGPLRGAATALRARTLEQDRGSQSIRRTPGSG